MSEQIPIDPIEKERPSCRVDVIRWGRTLRSASELKTQDCSWGGFSGKFLSFVPSNNQDMVDFWKEQVAKQVGADVFASKYIIEIPISFDDLMRLGEMCYSSDQAERALAEKKLKDLGVYISLSSDGKGKQQIAETRLYRTDLVKIFDR